MLQEYRVFNETSLLHIPSHLTYEEASCWPCAGVTAWNALFGGIPLIPGQTVLFQGTGGVSISGLILAHAAGARVRLLSTLSLDLHKVATTDKTLLSQIDHRNFRFR